MEAEKMSLYSIQKDFEKLIEENQNEEIKKAFDEFERDKMIHGIVHNQELITGIRDDDYLEFKQEIQKIVEDKDNQLWRHKVTIQKLQRDNREFEEALDSSTKRKLELKDKIKELKKEIKMLENRKIWLSEKDTEIKQLKQQLKEYKEIVEQVEKGEYIPEIFIDDLNELSKLRDEIKQLKKQLKDKDRKFETLLKVNKQLSLAIEGLEEDLNELEKQLKDSINMKDVEEIIIKRGGK